MSPSAGGAEQRVGDGVQQRVGIRMAEQARACAGSHAAEHQLAARRPARACPSLRRCAEAASRLHRAPCSQQRLGQREVVRIGDLKFCDAARHQQRRVPQRLDRAGFVGHAVAGALQRLAAACRCGTSAASAPATCRARSSVCATRPVAPRALSVSATGSASRPPTASSLAGVDQRVDPVPARSGSARRRAPAPSPPARRRAAPARRGRRGTLAARVAPPQRATRTRASRLPGAWLPNCVVVRRDARPGCWPGAARQPGPRACAPTIGRPATRRTAWPPRRRRACRRRHKARGRGSGAKRAESDGIDWRCKGGRQALRAAPAGAEGQLESGFFAVRQGTLPPSMLLTGILSFPSMDCLP